MKVVKIKIPIYFGVLEIVVAKNLRKALEKRKEPIGTFKPEDYTAFVWKDTEKGFPVYKAYFKPTASMKTIAHEATHIVNLMFEQIGAKLDLQNDEPQAYLMGWVVEQMEKAVKSYGKG